MSVTFFKLKKKGSAEGKVEKNYGYHPKDLRFSARCYTAERDGDWHVGTAWSPRPRARALFQAHTVTRPSAVRGQVSGPHVRCHVRPPDSGPWEGLSTGLPLGKEPPRTQTGIVKSSRDTGHIIMECPHPAKP